MKFTKKKCISLHNSKQCIPTQFIYIYEVSHFDWMHLPPHTRAVSNFSQKNYTFANKNAYLKLKKTTALINYTKPENVQDSQGNSNSRKT